MKKRLVVMTVVAAMAATACSVDTTPSNVPTEPVYTPVVPQVPAQPQPEQDTVKTYAYGEAATADNVVVIVGVPEPYSPSDTAMGVSGEPVKFHVAVTNRRSTVYQPGMLSIAGTSGTTQAEQIFDSGGGIVTPMGANLLPGETLEWDVAFGVANPSDITLSVTPDIGGTTVIYES